MDVGLVDRIYECAALPQLWPDVLDELAQIAGARGGVLFAADLTADILRWTASPLSVDDMAAYAADGVLMRSLRLERLAGADHAGFVRDNDILSSDEMDRDPSYRDFLRPRGLGYAAASLIPLPTAEMLIFSVEREHARGPVEAAAVQRLDALRPHLARSALLSSRLRLEQAQSMTQALGLIGLPCLAFDARGVVLAANTLVELLDAFVGWRSHDRIALRDRSADALLQAAVDSLATAAAPSVRSFAVRDAAQRAAMIAHVVPVRRAAGDIFTRSVALLILSPVGTTGAPPVELIQSLFDLTPTESRVARDLAAKATVAEIATRTGAAPSTVRTHVRNILDKTGCRRQAEVVALLGGCVLPRSIGPEGSD